MGVEYTLSHSSEILCLERVFFFLKPSQRSLLLGAHARTGGTSGFLNRRCQRQPGWAATLPQFCFVTVSLEATQSHQRHHPLPRKEGLLSIRPFKGFEGNGKLIQFFSSPGYECLQIAETWDRYGVAIASLTKTRSCEGAFFHLFLMNHHLRVNRSLYSFCDDMLNY